MTDAPARPVPEPKGPRRFLVLAASVLLLVFLGTGQAWSVFITPLKAAYGFTDSQLQLVFTTTVFTFCFMIIPAGRLHDRFGPRPLVVVAAALMAAGWALASCCGSRFGCLWAGAGFLASAGSAVGYTCPVATAIKWFPRRAGLIAGLSAAGYGLGPILLSNVSEVLLHRGWAVPEIFRFVGKVWPPMVLALGMLLILPPGFHPRAHPVGFSTRSFFRDRRFWALFAGMFFGTLPYLVVMGTVKPLGTAFHIGPMAAGLAITFVAVGNTSGRIFWGHYVDRLGPRTAMLTSQALMGIFMLSLMGLGQVHPGLFLAAVCGVGFCYGSNFAIYPSTVARLYGVRVLGSVYPFIMAAQGIASLAPTASGLLHDRTGSYFPGLIMATTLGLIGLAVTWFLALPASRADEAG